MMWLADRLQKASVMLTVAEQDWLNGQFAKICVRVGSERELMDVVDAARKADLLVYLVIDAGRTEFHGIPTPTCCAIGPDFAELIDPITQHLTLY
jgi:PTH2 family peptidyl-tRNA hydrolase